MPLYYNADIKFKNTTREFGMTDFLTTTYNDQDILFNAGDPAERFYMIESGQVSIIDAKRNIEIALLSEGDCFGEQSILKGGLRAATAKAIGKTVCQEMTVQNLRQIMSTSSGIATPMLEALLLQLSLHNSLRRAVQA